MIYHKRTWGIFNSKKSSMIHFILKFAAISLIYKIKESIKIFSFVVKFLIIFMIEDGFSIVAILGRVCTVFGRLGTTRNLVFSDGI